MTDTQTRCGNDDAIFDLGNWTGVIDRVRQAELSYMGTDYNINTVDIGSYPDDMPLMTNRTYPATRMLLRPKGVRSFMAAMWWVDAMAERGMDVPELILPCVPGARQDRINVSGDYLFTLKSVAREINMRRFPRVLTLDPHSDVTPALIERCVVVPPYLGCLRGRTYDGVIAPDGGATKRAGAVAAMLGVPLFHGWKKRDVATGKLAGFGLQTIEKGHYVVVDDLCDGGGTFIGLSDEIAKTGSTADLYVTHGLFTKGTRPLLDVFNGVFCTDSVLGDKPGVTVVPRCTSLLFNIPSQWHSIR